MEIWSNYGTYIVGGLIVLAVLVLLFLVLRSLGGRVRGGKGARLGISEYHEIDKDRRLVLIRRDDVEHLLLIGGTQDLVIESGIDIADLEDVETESYAGRSAPEPALKSQAPRPVPMDLPAESPPLRPAPRPA